MFDVYGSLGSSQDSKCASSAILGKDFLTSSPPSYLGQAPSSGEKKFPTALVVGGLIVGGALLYYATQVGGSLAANPKKKHRQSLGRVLSRAGWSSDLAWQEMQALGYARLDGDTLYVLTDGSGDAPPKNPRAEVFVGRYWRDKDGEWGYVDGDYFDDLRSALSGWRRNLERRNNPLLRELTLDMTDPRVRYVAFVREAGGPVWSASFASKRDAERWVEANSFRARIEPWPPKDNPGRAQQLGFTRADADPEQLRRGIKHELEHTSSRKVAERIALDHLAEGDDRYYTHLEQMEADVAEEDKEPFSQWDWWRGTRPYDNPSVEASCAADCKKTFGKGGADKPAYLKKCLAGCHGTLLGKGLFDVPKGA